MFIDHYCERTAPGVFDEPVNSLTNLAFLLAAACFWHYCRRRSDDGSVALGDALLALSVALTGMGSMAFHLLANSFTEWLDIITIMNFQLLWLWLYMHRIMQLNAGTRIVMLCGYLFLSVTLSLLPEPTPGTMGFAGPLLVICLLSFYHSEHAAQERHLMFYMSGLFFVSLVLRNLDTRVCEYTPFGTHFLWHLFNAVVVYGLCRAAATPVQSSDASSR